MRMFSKSKAVEAVQWTGDNYAEIRALWPDSGITDGRLWIMGNYETHTDNGGERKVPIGLWDWVVKFQSGNWDRFDTEQFRSLFQDSQDADLTYLETGSMINELARRDHNFICARHLIDGRPELFAKGDLVTLLGLSSILVQHINSRAADRYGPDGSAAR